MMLNASFASVLVALIFQTINLFDVINAERSYSESTYVQNALGFAEDHFDHQGKAYDDY